MLFFFEFAFDFIKFDTLFILCDNYCIFNCILFDTSCFNQTKMTSEEENRFEEPAFKIFSKIDQIRNHKTRSQTFSQQIEMV